MIKIIYRLFFIIIFSVFIVSCGGSGGDAPVATNTDCVLGTSQIGNCTI